MTINTALAGKTYPTTTYQVTADAIRTYAAATNEDNPAFTGSDLVGPPAFPIVPAQAVLGGALFDPELEVNLMRLVHGEEDHLLLAPIRPGEHRLGRDDGEGGRPDGIAPGEGRIVVVRRRRVGTDRIRRHLVDGGGVRLAGKRRVDCQRKPPFSAPLSCGAPRSVLPQSRRPRI
ncbi:MAG TPA: MaoC family dehydratase N-terminal domain-containing protein [Acidimicrobiia bacterium]|nr:MaoC family dehydratase N-terminal domain-containing protein [Acidimicrobiia bacterium]